MSRQKFPDIEVGKLPGREGVCEISALGSYIRCSRWVDGKDEVFIFTVAGDLVQSWTEHHRPSHGDMAVDADGREVYVAISKSDPDMYQVIKRRLDDGMVTALAPRGEASHASTRAINKPRLGNSKATVPDDLAVDQQGRGNNPHHPGLGDQIEISQALLARIQRDLCRKTCG